MFICTSFFVLVTCLRFYLKIELENIDKLYRMEIETEKLKENNGNFTGAGKRKNYKRKFSDIREATPADR